MNAIDVEGVSKLYRLGADRAAYGTLREALSRRRHRRRGTGRPELWALRDVSFEVAMGEALGIIGANGAGKSTLLKVISRITRPTHGRVTVRGRIGSLLEVGTGFHPELTGRENIFLSGAILGMRKSEIQRKFDQIVEFADLAPFLGTALKRYSTGMQMRLAFSVAAHLEPEILLVDEVLAVGDLDFQRRCLGRMSEIERSGRTVLFVSHNMGAIQRLCPRSVLLRQGRLVAEGQTAEVVQRYYDQASPQTGDGEEEAGSDGNFRAWFLRSPSGLPGHVMRSGDACQLVFRLATAEELRNAFVGVAIYASDGTLICALSSFDIEERYLSLPAGRHELAFELPSLPVKTGDYHVYVTLNTKEEGTVESWAAQPGFRVTPSHHSVQVPPPWEGVLALRGSFAYRPWDEGSSDPGLRGTDPIESRAGLRA